MSEKITLEITPEHAIILERALETYSRLRIGQVETAISVAFPEKIVPTHSLYSESQKVCQKLFPDEPHLHSPMASKGVHTDSDAGIAWDTLQVVRRFNKLHQSDGVWGSGTWFDDPHRASNLPLPKIPQENKYHFKEVLVPKAQEQLDKLWKNTNEPLLNEKLQGDEVSQLTQYVFDRCDYDGAKFDFVIIDGVVGLKIFKPRIKPATQF